MWKEYIYLFLNLHEFLDIIFSNMIYRPDSALIIWRPLEVSCSEKKNKLILSQQRKTAQPKYYALGS